MSGALPARIVIIGGGFSGATLAYHLAAGLAGRAADIVVIEPRARLGAGLAYSTNDPSHRINVPANRMTMDCAVEDGLQRWIDEARPPLSPGTRTADGAIFAQRGLVADYIGAQLAPYLAAGKIRHIRARAIAARREGGGYTVTLDRGAAITADRLVLAISHPAPGVPASFRALQDDARLVADPSDAAGVARVAQSARSVLVLGTGLTSADVIASLDRQGYGGRILALSRRGLRSRGHAGAYPQSTADFTHHPETRAVDVLARVRKAVREDAARGLPWQAALDNVRKQGGAIWAALAPDQRARLVRRLRVWWDVHRFRIAPQVEAVLDDLAAQGRLITAAGHLVRVSAAMDGIAVVWRPARQTHNLHETFDAVILTTGPAHDAIFARDPLVASLAEAGLVRPDPNGLGIDVTQICHAVAADGHAVPDLLIVGPLARGHMGELMGIPEVTAHAEAVAATLLESIP